MSILLGIDTGGTYTDAVLLDDEQGVIRKVKTLTTKHDLSVGIGDAIQTILADPRPDVRLVSLSTTLATNAIAEGQGDPICLLLIGYDPDLLRGTGLDKLLAPDDIVFVSGGHSVTGEPLAELDVRSAEQAILAHAPHVAAFGISAFGGVRNPAHELQVCELVRGLTGLPATCGHELTTHLHAPRRALTVALNARLIHMLRRLILAVRDVLARHSIRAPLMVVRGDGSLMDANMALERPVETILSGPAASVTGACYLAKATDAFIIDVGGTTTDIAVLRTGRPVVNHNTAFIGEWHTMVEALRVHSFGLGGDSDVGLNEAGELRVGPRRVIPLSALAQRYPAVLDVLRHEVLHPMPAFEAARETGRFVVRQREAEQNRLSATQQEIWGALADGPVAVPALLGDTRHVPLYRHGLEQLASKGLVIGSAFTPTDAVHVLGGYQCGSVEAAELGATLWGKRLNTSVRPFCRRVVRQVALQLGQALVATILAEENGLAADTGSGQLLVDRALGADHSGSLSVTLGLRRPLVAVGAPVAAYLPPVARRLRARLSIPEHAEVGSAVGAVAGGIVQTVRVLVRMLKMTQLYRAYLPSGIRDFSQLDEAVACAREEASHSARDHAQQAGAAAIHLDVARHDRSLGGICFETEITVTAVGRPSLGS